MFEEFRKSINSVLYERVVSPLFGTFIFTWLVWNWKILVLLFFVNEEKLNTTKAEFIAVNFNNSNNLIIYPIISTAILLTIVPFISNGAYWLNLKFQKWRYDQKNHIERRKLLTIEQSLQLREEIENQKEKFVKLIQSKNSEIEQLTQEIELIKKNPKNNTISKPKLNIVTKDPAEKYSHLLDDDNNFIELRKVISKIQNSVRMFAGDNTPSSDFVSYLEAHDLIRNKGNGSYEFTEDGKDLLKTYSKIRMK